jgi:hypothetical protein
MMGAPARGVEIPLFSAEAQAQAHCPSDEVVWLNLPTGIYHIRGSRWYSATKSGAYVCRAEADRAGYRASRNG